MINNYTEGQCCFKDCKNKSHKNIDLGNVYINLCSEHYKQLRTEMIRDKKDNIINLFNKGLKSKEIEEQTGYSKNTVKTVKYNYSYLIKE